MTSFLDYQVALLFAQYGRQALLKAVAEKMHLSHEELESLLKDILQRPISTAKKRPMAESLDRLIQQHPEKAELLRALRDRFHNRTFLPELRDVRRLFEQRGQSLGSTKSRADSLPRLLHLLAELSTSELEALGQSQAERSYSSLGLISDEIMRREK